MADPRDVLVRNEQAELTATYLNGVAMALAAVGGIAPSLGPIGMFLTGLLIMYLTRQRQVGRE